MCFQLLVMLEYYNHLQQGSEDWNKIRHDLKRLIITSTDAAYIMQVSKYKTREQWSENKLNPISVPLNECMSRGSFFEIQAATVYTKMHPECKFYTTGICIDSETNLGYSPDLMVDDDGLVEIKCPRWGGYRLQPPPEHICQMQHAMGISGRKWCDYVQWISKYPDSINIIRISFDDIFWKHQKETCIQWRQVLMDRIREKDLQMDSQSINNKN